MSQQTLPCTPPPPRTAESGLISYINYVSSVPKKMSSKGSLNISELFRFKDPKNVVFQHTHSNQILIHLTLFDNIE